MALKDWSDDNSEMNFALPGAAPNLGAGAPDAPQLAPKPGGLMSLADLQAKSDEVAKQKQYLNILGGVAQNFADVPTAYEQLYHKGAPHTNIKGTLSALADSIQDPAAKQASLIAQRKGLAEGQQLDDQQASMAMNKDPNSNLSKSKKMIAAKYGIQATPEMSGYDIDQLMDTKKMNEEQAKSQVDFNNDIRKQAFGKKLQSQLSRENFDHEFALKKDERENEAPKPDQTQAATFGRRLEQAENVFADLSKGGFNRADLKQGAMAKLIPDALQGENLRRQDQAERNFVNAILRRESGAAISQSEFDSAEKQYFPRPGDPPSVLAQKEANRKQAALGLQVAAGRAWNKIPLVNPEQRRQVVKTERNKRTGETRLTYSDGTQEIKPSVAGN